MKIQKILILLILLITFSIADNSTVLESAETEFGIAKKHSYSYYKIDASKGDRVTIKLNQMDADGDLYVRIGAIATKDKWDYKSINSKAKDEKITFVLSGDNTIYISVYAYKCIRTVEHKIRVEINNNEEKGSVKRFPKNLASSDKFVTYTPSDGIDSTTPVVLFLNGLDRTLDKYDGIMSFLADKGYFVIGAYSNSYNPNYSKDIFNDVINATKRHSNLTLNKLAVIGHSLGGGNGFYVMKHFQDLGYGRDGSLVFSLEGWFPFGMKADDFKELDGHIALLQMNGKKGTDDIDPLMNLTIWNLAENSKKFLLTLPENNHFYIEGSRDNISEKRELLEIVAKITDDAFSDSQDGYKSIASENKATYDAVYKSVQRFGSYGCDGSAGNAIGTLNSLGNDIDYCSPQQY